MDFLQPANWAEALQARAERPDALPFAGGTDVMVELNFDRRRPGALLDLTRVSELREWSVTHYLMPTILDMPPTISSGPAVAAAVRAACGKPLRRVPIRPEHITGT